MIVRQPPTRVNQSGDMMTERVRVGGPEKISLYDVLVELNSLDATDVRVSQGMFIWTRPATAEEKKSWADAQDRYEAYTEKWERETLIRLKEKYESSTSDPE
jgi:hypothetical protein